MTNHYSLCIWEFRNVHLGNTQREPSVRVLRERARVDVWMGVVHKLHWWLLRSWVLGIDLYVGQNTAVVIGFAEEELVSCWFLGGNWNGARSRLQADGLHAGERGSCGSRNPTAVQRKDLPVEGALYVGGEMTASTIVGPVAPYVPFSLPLLPTSNPLTSPFPH